MCRQQMLAECLDARRVAQVEPDDLEPVGPVGRIDLGGLSVKGDPALEVRLQVDEASQQVVAVMLVGQDGALELRPFAAPRNEDMWADLRPRLAADAVESLVAERDFAMLAWTSASGTLERARMDAVI